MTERLRAMQCWAWWSLAMLLLLSHALVAWKCLGGYRGIASRYPIVVDDHLHNYYTSLITRRFLSDSGTTSGYNPQFMSGYVRSIIWPPSTTPADLVLWLTGFGRPEVAYKLYVFGMFVLAPLLVWLGLRQWSAGPAGAAFGLALYIVLFWTDMPMPYMRFGMVAFVVSTAFSLLVGGLFVRVIQSGSASVGIGYCVLLPVACLVHLTVPVSLGPPLIAVYLLEARRLRLRQHAWLWLAALLTPLVNGFWLLPGILLWQTRGETGTAFINPEGLSRLKQLFGEAPWIELVLLVLGLVGAVWLRVKRVGSETAPESELAAGMNMSPVARRSAVAVCVWNFFLGYAAGGMGILGSLQPGRYTLALFVWCIPLAVHALDSINRWVRAQFGVAVARTVAISLAAGAVLLLGPRLFDTARSILIARASLLPAELPESHEHVLEWVRTHVQPGERIFFEERSRGYPMGPDPMATYRLSALIPLNHPVELIGGPYLFAHLKTNFSQLGDGRFIGGRPWDRNNFVRYTHLYGARYVICWSPPARLFCQSNPDLVTVLEETKEFSFARTHLPAAAAFQGSASVHATLNELHVKQAVVAEGELVLRYHWVPGLTTDPPLPIRPRHLLDDPVPFISVPNAPSEFRIRFDFWSLIRKSGRTGE